jgi:hypothetical protein
MKRLVALTLVLAVLVPTLAAFAQDGGAAKELPKQKMKMYQIVMLKQGPNWKSQGSAEGMDVRMQVIANIRKAAQEGLVVSAGLINDETNVEFVVIMDLETKTEAYKILNKAPKIKDGYYSADIYSYFTSEGITVQK